MASDAFFFIGVLFFFFMLWLVSGGPTRPISFAGPYITPITDVDTVQEGYDDENGWINTTGNAIRGGIGQAPQQIQQGIAGVESDLHRLQGEAADARAFGSASPYRDQVSITSVAPGTDSKSEYVTIQLSPTASGSVTISGWRLRSDASGNGGIIPNGTEVPYSGVNPVAPIVLYPGDTATIATGDSPIGVSFRENMCVGYLGTRQSFNPPLWSMCPAPLDEFDRYYSGNKLKDDRCYYYLQTQQQCTTVTRPPSDLSSECDRVIDTYLSYSGCVATHRYESSFRGSSWRIYLERGGKLWKSSREAVKLLDQNGLTVDLYTY